MFLSNKISDLMARYRKPKNQVSNDSKDQDVSFKHNNLKRSLLFGGIGITLITIFVLFSQLQSNQVIQPPVTKRFNHNWHTAKSTWQPNTLSDNQLREVARLVQQVDVVPIFNPFMIPRPPGTLNSTLVQMHIEQQLAPLGWTIEKMTFEAKPPDPYQETTFTNLIATHNPEAVRRLVLACHHDSKITPTGFLGATDSAMPCSMMIEIAHALRQSLDSLKTQQRNGQSQSDLTLELIFFDGEEAYLEWSATDSLYGSRHMVNEWRLPWNGRTRLDSIDLFVLLDLIGTMDTQFLNFHVTNTRWYQRLTNLELRMYHANLLTVDNIRHRNQVFNPRQLGQAFMIDDDHKYFAQAGVPILHLISYPFPSVWHTMGDNASVMNYQRTEVISRVIAAFVCEYLHLNV